MTLLIAAAGCGEAIAVVAGLGFISLFVLIAVYASKWQEQRRRNLAFVLGKYGGRLVASGDWFSGERGELTIEGLPAKLTWYGGSKNSPPYTRIELGLGGRGRLRIAPQGIFLGLRKFFGAQDVEIGDPHFDNAFEIESSPVAYAGRVCNDAARRALLDLVSDSPTLDVQPARVLLSVRRDLTGEADPLTRFLERASVVAAALLAERGDAAPSGGVEVVAVATAAGSCLTCGTDLDATAVACAKCGTKQHKDCWNYVGGCATFACGSGQQKG